MHELITRLIEKTGISPEQAHKTIDTIKEFVKEKFPMMAGAVDNLFPAADNNAANDKTAAANNEDLFDFAKDKLGGMFGGDIK